MTSKQVAPTAWVRTACPMDCPDACSLEAGIVDERVVALRGSDLNPVTAGYICAKMTHYPDRVNGSDRLLTPMRRVGPKGEGRFEPISWHDALDLVATRLRDTIAQHGGEAILPYHYDGSNGVFAHDWIDEALWRRLGTSQLDRTLCAAPATETATRMYGKMAGVAFPDYIHAKTIVMWGANASVANIHLVPHLNAARKAGAQIVVIDPRRTPVAEKATLHLPIWPGTDMALALWLIAETERRGIIAREFLARHTHHFEPLLARARTWTLAKAADTTRLAPADLERLADLYFDASPALIRLGWGAERCRNGDGNMAAVLAIPAFAGKFGVRGGGYTLSNSGSYRAQTENLVAFPLPRPEPRTINMSRLGEALDPTMHPAIRALVVYNANPMVSTPAQNAVRRGLLRDDLFTVVLEQVMTDTCAYADVLLPVPTFLEHHELHRGYGAMVVQRIDPVVKSRGDTRSNPEVFAALAERLGFDGPDFDIRPEVMTAHYLKACKGLPPEAAARLARTGLVEVEFDGQPGPVQFGDSFPLTHDQKADLWPAVWQQSGHDVFAYEPVPRSEKFPLAMLSPSTAKTINSILGELDDAELPCAIHPDDARARGIADGELVRVFNDEGEVKARARHDATLRPGICVIPKGVWLRNCPGRANANALIGQAVSGISGGATYNDTRVEIARG